MNAPDMYKGFEASLVGMGGVFTVLVLFYLLTKFMTTVSARPVSRGVSNQAVSSGRSDQSK